MASNPRLNSILGQLQDNAAFQQLKAKWDEQDQSTRTALKLGSMIGGALLILIVLLSSWLGVAEKREEVQKKLELVRKIQLSQEELRRLRSVTGGAGLAGGEEDWASYFEGRATESGISTDAMSAAPKKSPNSKSAPNTPEEMLVDLELKKVNVRQLVKFVYHLENGPRTVKVRNLLVDTLPDESGYMDARIAVSGFTLSRSP